MAWSSAINMDLTKLGIQISKIESYFNQFLKKVKDDKDIYDLYISICTILD